MVLECLDEAKYQNGSQERSQRVHACKILELRLIADLLVRIPCLVLWYVNPRRKQRAGSRSIVLEFWYVVVGEQKKTILGQRKFQSNPHGGTGYTREKRSIGSGRLGIEASKEWNDDRGQQRQKKATIKR